MPHIRLLDETVAQKIAAGEVVERPASVIKELVENSIDAGSTHITVEIRDGGITYLRVTDNGCGIAQDEVKLAFFRHATSKLENAEGLSHITQMGFRGEALYSIAAVSRLEMVTKPAEQPLGTQVVIEGGKIISLQEQGCPDGTTITVRDLFFNTPARLKFLSKPATEASNVASMLGRLILARPDISIKYVSGGRTVYHSAGDGDLRSAMFAVYGKEAAAGLIETRQTWGKLSVRGFIGDAYHTRGTRTLQLLYVNNRPITQANLLRSAESAYSGITGAGKYPIFVLNIQLPPEEVDVNVHPNKLSVRFADERRVRELLYTAVSNALGRQLSAPGMIRPAEEKKPIKVEPMQWPLKTELPTAQPAAPIAAERREETPAPAVRERNELVQPKAQPIAQPKAQPPQPAAEERPMARTVAQFVSMVQDAMEPAESLQPVIKAQQRAAAPVTLHQNPVVPPAAPPKPAAPLPQEELPLKKEPPKPEPMTVQEEIAAEEAPVRTAIYGGKVFDTYIILWDAQAMYIVDQHAAHERLLYERYLKAVRTADLVVQPLLIPESFDVTYEDQILLEENMELFSSMGFEIDRYGRLSYIIRAVPMLLGEVSAQGLLRELLDSLAAGKPADPVESKRERLMTMACRSAVKGGDKLSEADISALLELIVKEKTPLSCPHGRPIVLVMEKNALEKHFKRSR